MSRLDVSSLRAMARGMRELPMRLSQLVAEAAAPVLTRVGQDSFARQENPYGVPWAPGVDGQTVDLDKTGAMKRDIRYAAIGSRLRSVLGPAYAKYQVGKRQVLPTPGTMPKAYTDELARVTGEVIKKYTREWGPL